MLSNAKSSLMMITYVSLLSACGGGSADTTTQAPIVPIVPIATQNKSLSGKVIDGYVRGATVWVDLNANGEMDAGEPSTVSTDAGDYVLELSDQETQYVQHTLRYMLTYL